jgi:hypothetical protein
VFVGPVFLRRGSLVMHGAALQLLCSFSVVAHSVFLPACALEDCLVSRRFWLLVPFGSRLIDVTHRNICYSQQQNNNDHSINLCVQEVGSPRFSVHAPLSQYTSTSDSEANASATQEPVDNSNKLVDLAAIYWILIALLGILLGLGVAGACTLMRRRRAARKALDSKQKVRFCSLSLSCGNT